MRKPSPGNRILIGDSGIEFEVGENVASGLVSSHKAEYADGLPAPGKRIGRARHKPEEVEDPEPETVDLESLSIPKLKQLAEERNIDLGDAKSKAALVDIIAEALEDDQE